MASKNKVGFISLGCPKALVDSERILTQLRMDGYDIVPSYDDADIVVVNTCGFIDSAKQESLDAIGEALDENGKVIVTGCLGARREQIMERFPDVLEVTGPHQYESVVTAVHQHLPPVHDPHLSLIPPQGLKLTPRHYAYLKISEGCNHKCSFCVIPSMRGALTSRPVAEVLTEAEALVKAGVKELLVISQDTSAYGTDIAYEESSWHGVRRRAHLQDLAEGLSELGAWVRLHYVYPYPHVDKLIPLMAEGKLLPYLDVPFQHASPRILKLMKRPASRQKNLERIEAWRRICPELTIRSTFIVGFPGESDTEFDELLSFIEEAQLDRVGCFTYSPVEGASANALPDAISEACKKERYNRFMTLQRDISRSRLKARIGTTLRVLVDTVDGCGAVGRSAADAPEIDGVVEIDDGSALSPGDWVEVRIEAASDYDLLGRLAGGGAIN